MIKLLLGGLIVTGVGFGAAVLTSDISRSSTSPPGRVAEREAISSYVTAPVAIGDIQRTISATGTLQAISTVAVSSQLSGQIEELRADFNDHVEAGQALAALDRRGFEARVAEAEAAVDMARGAMAARKAQQKEADGAMREAIARRAVFEARIAAATAALDTAERALERTRKLADRKTVAAAALEDAEHATALATVDLQEARAVAKAHEHAIAATRAAKEEADAAHASATSELAQKEAALAIVRHDLARSTIRSPIAGVVIGRNVERGQTVAASLDAPVLFTIAGSLDRMEIHANVDETDIGEIALSQPAAFSVDAYPERLFDAEVTEIRKAPRIVQGVVIYTVVLSASNPEGLLLPGMTSTVRIVVAEAGPVRTVPLAALGFTPGGSMQDTHDATADPGGDSGTTIWVLADAGTVQARDISIGIDDGRNVAVIGGELARHERVITGEAPEAPTASFFGIEF